MGKRICAWCGEEIRGYPHVTLWDENSEESIGIRFHSREELAMYLNTMPRKIKR